MALSTTSRDTGGGANAGERRPEAQTGAAARKRARDEQRQERRRQRRRTTGRERDGDSEVEGRWRQRGRWDVKVFTRRWRVRTYAIQSRDWRGMRSSYHVRRSGCDCSSTNRGSD